MGFSIHRGDDTLSEQELIWLEPLSPKEIIEDELVKKHKMEKFVVLFSGGQDSSCVDDFIAREYPEYYEGRIFTNTGIASPIARKFALENSTELGRKIEMTWARKSYYDIVVKEGIGFPTAGGHSILMGYLKFHSWYWYLKPRLKKGEKICFISGVRKKESWMRDKKKFYTKKPIDVNATMTFCKPFLYKNGEQLQEYRIKQGIKKSSAYDWFGKSGECWCGCFYNKWELKMLELHDPFVFNTIKWLESQVQKRIKSLQEIEIPLAKKLHKTTEDLREQLTNLIENPYWGGSVGANMSRLQRTLDEFQLDVNYEDYCGESCEV